jgi:hypothetical protein
MNQLLNKPPGFVGKLEKSVIFAVNEKDPKLIYIVKIPTIVDDKNQL